MNETKKIKGSLLFNYFLSVQTWGNLLTPDEHDVVAAMNASDYNPFGKVQVAAETLGKSRWTVYRHLASIRKKTRR